MTGWDSFVFLFFGVSSAALPHPLHSLLTVFTLTSIQLALLQMVSFLASPNLDEPNQHAISKQQHSLVPQ
jgi:hypothetical protein